MPRRHANREAILDALTPAQRVVLEEALHALGVGSRWHLAPAIAGFWEALAFTQLAERIQLEEGVPLGRARCAAAIRLGIDDGAVTRRLRDQRRATMKITPEEISSTPGRGAA